MREGWKVKIFDEVISDSLIGIVRNNKQQSPANAYRYFKMSNIRNDNGINEDSFTFVNASDDEVARYKLENNDFLFNTRNSYELVGKTCLYSSNYSKPTLFNNNILRVRFKPELLPQFVAYVFCTPNILNELKKMKSGTTNVVGIYYKSLKNLEIPIPPLAEQKQIVAILDKAFTAIDQAKANIEKNIENAKELFDNKKAEYFERLSLKNKLIPITKACEKIFAGGDKPKPNFSKIQTDEFNVPVISNGEKNDGLFGYTNFAKVLKPAITVSARGTIGYTSYRDYPFVPIVRLIVMIPKTDLINIEFLMHAIKNLDILRTGSSIPQLTVPMIKGYSIPIPSKEKQKDIVDSLNKIETELEGYKSAMETKKMNLEELKKSILQKAFAGELTQKAVAV